MSICVAELMTLGALIMAQGDLANPSYTQVDYPWVSVVLSLQDEPAAEPQEEPAELQDPDLPEDSGQEPGDEPPPMDEIDDGSELPFIDWDNLEGSFRLSFVSYGGEYDADAEPGFGVSFRAPIPDLSFKDEAKWSGDMSVDSAGCGYVCVYGELIISSLDRDIDSLSTKSGTTFFLGFGLDYTFHRDDEWMVMARAGFQYGKFGGVSDVDSGIAITIGASVGYKITDQMWLTFTPDVAFGDGENIIFTHFGLSYKF